ncbi:MAG: hypothetical protein JSU83_06385 [Deltaproteobacteria bacterium]|nr:MAG: hypothetical protein JSU83_06385 [Deltaproteobacteria bacterium]
MKGKDLYSTAHLFVAAIRIWEHQNSKAPSLEDISSTLSFSAERTNFVCKQLEEKDIIEVVEGAYGTRLFVKNHLKIEDIPRDEKASKLDDEISKFKQTQKKLTQKIESFKAEQAQKKKSLFEEVEKKLKDQLDKK